MDKHAGKRVRILGWMVSEKLTQTKKGEPMEFATVEDRSAIYEAMFFPDVYRRVWHLVKPNQLFLVDGIVEHDFGVPMLNVKQLTRIRAFSQSRILSEQPDINRHDDVGNRANDEHPYHSNPSPGTKSSRSAPHQLVG